LGEESKHTKCALDLEDQTFKLNINPFMLEIELELFIFIHL